LQCPKCRAENPETFTYCGRCHAPLKYTCPACQHVQLRGGTCEKCGVDFAKYAAMLAFRARDQFRAERAKARGRAVIWKQVLLFPLTGGLSLIKYLAGRLRGD
jgi:hypothetical protein